MKYAVRLHHYNYQNAVVDFEQQVNVERLRTMYDGDLSNIQAEINILDPRRFTSKQRRLYWSLLSDIYNWSGQGVNELHDWFKQEYAIKYYELVSLSDESNNTVSDLNKLIDIVINFMFEYNVPFKKVMSCCPKTKLTTYTLVVYIVSVQFVANQILTYITLTRSEWGITETNLIT